MNNWLLTDEGKHMMYIIIDCVGVETRIAGVGVSGKTNLTFKTKGRLQVIQTVRRN